MQADQVTHRGPAGPAGRDGRDGRDGIDGHSPDPTEIAAEVQRQVTLAWEAAAFPLDFNALRAEVQASVSTAGKDLERSVTVALQSALQRVEAKEGQRGPRGPKGERGEPGEPGPAPKHEWSGTRLRFEKPGGGWGDWVDLRGPQGFGGVVASAVASSATGNAYFPQGW